MSTSGSSRECKKLPREERDKLVVELYQKGVPVEEIAEKACINRATIYSILRRHGIQPSRKTRRSRELTPEEEKKLVEEYLSGIPVQELMEKYGLSATKLYNILSKYGVPRRAPRRSHSHRRITPEEVEEIRKLYEQGASVYEIAKRLKRPISTVYAVLKRLGLK